MKYYLINFNNVECIEVVDQITLGRKSSCSIVLKDDLVSGRHCRFHVNERAVFIEDLNASNPVQVNDVRMNPKERVKLKINDKLQIGSTQYFLNNKMSDDNLTHKSMILEKVKIHETFESDIDYEQNNKYWHKEASKKKLQVLKIEKRLKSLIKKDEITEDSSNELKEIEESLSSLQKRLVKFKKYENDEILKKIEYFTERIEYFTSKKKEVSEIKSLNDEILLLIKRKKDIESGTKTTSKENEEYEELSKLYKTELHELSIIHEKIKKK